MLLRFGTSNFRSLAEYQEISLVASGLLDDGVHLLASPAIKESVLPSVVLYGANASGKTSMLKAMEKLVEIVQHSHARGGPRSKFMRNRFALDSEYADEPTQFDCDFILNDIRYHFGFTVSDSEVISEWLYFFNGAYKNTLYERDAGKPIKFGRSLRGQNKTIEDIVRKNSLFLSAAAQNNHPDLTVVFEYIVEKFVFQISEVGEADSFSIIQKGKIDLRAISFLKFADTGIVDAIFEDSHWTPEIEKFTEKFQEFINNSFKDFRKNKSESEPDSDDDINLVEVSKKKIKLGHSGVGTDPVYLDISQESRGTVRLLNLITTIFEGLDNGSVVFVDELDNSLHTVIAQEVIKLFSSQGTNQNGAQLIFTTHDTNLMGRHLLRRDQIYLCEKSNRGDTCVYPLSDLKVRRGDNLGKGYLQGRFGGVPFFGDGGVQLVNPSGDDG